MMKRIIMHWTGGDGQVNGLDLEHYHSVVDAKGRVVWGIHKPEANLNIKNGDYAAHTRGCNTGSIGTAMAAMSGAIQRPFKAGAHPITAPQLTAFVKHVADFCDLYKIPVTRKTVLTHAEVEPTLDIWQRGKWDICWIPGMDAPADPVQVGDNLRARISFELERIRVSYTPPKKSLFRGLLK
jgi:hypothetical protein